MITGDFENTQSSNTIIDTFKSNLENKTLIYFYQITCKDPNITDNYIGQTECFESREAQHKRNSEISNYKVYQIIRDNGGWDNWNMKVIYHYYCKDQYEARQIEQKWINVFKSTMNSARAYSKEYIDQQLDREIESKINDFSNKLLGCFLYDYYINLDFEEEQQITCQFCYKTFSSKSALGTHQKTTKYCLKLQNKEDIINFKCQYCNKSFTSKQQLTIHFNVCIEKKIKEILKEELEKKEIEYEKKLLLELEKKDMELKEKLEKKDMELKEKLEENDILKLKIAELRGQVLLLKDNYEFIKEIANQPKITNNNTTTNNL